MPSYRERRSRDDGIRDTFSDDFYHQSCPSAIIYRFSQLKNDFDKKKEKLAKEGHRYVGLIGVPTDVVRDERLKKVLDFQSVQRAIQVTSRLPKQSEWHRFGITPTNRLDIVKFKSYGYDVNENWYADQMRLMEKYEKNQKAQIEKLKKDFYVEYHPMVTETRADYTGGDHACLYQWYAITTRPKPKAGAGGDEGEDVGEHVPEDQLSKTEVTQDELVVGEVEPQKVQKVPKQPKQKIAPPPKVKAQTPPRQQRVEKPKIAPPPKVKAQTPPRQQRVEKPTKQRGKVVGETASRQTQKSEKKTRPTKEVRQKEQQQKHVEAPVQAPVEQQKIPVVIYQ